jgi:aminopeptidase N
MGIVANNEKEEAWLDEGFVNFFEDEIMDHYHGKDKSIFDLWGFKSGNYEQSRLEYTSLKDLEAGPIALPGWKQKQTGNFKAIVYAKTSLLLQTLKAVVGEKAFYQALRKYYETFMFSHPKEEDFIKSMKTSLGERLPNGLHLDSFFYQTLHTNDWCDYIVKLDAGKCQILNKGDFNFPIEILIKYKDGKEKRLNYGSQRSVTFQVENFGEVSSIELDPLRKNKFDKNLNNNSINFIKERKPSLNYAHKAMLTWQFIINAISYLV